MVVLRSEEALRQLVFLHVLHDPLLFLLQLILEEVLFLVSRSSWLSLLRFLFEFLQIRVSHSLLKVKQYATQSARSAKLLYVLHTAWHYTKTVTSPSHFSQYFLAYQHCFPKERSDGMPGVAVPLRSPEQQSRLDLAKK